jgi:long-chain acyl-CoA synthetase
LLAGATVNFPEEPGTTRGDLREIGPHAVMAPPRFWEAMCSEYQAKIADAGRLKRLATRVAFALGERATLGEDGGRRMPATPVLRALASVLVFGTMLDKFGLSRTRHAYAAGAPLDPDVFRFFRAIGLNLKPVYGHAESSGICAVPPDREVRVNTVGKPTPGVSVRVSADGEILVASESVFLGYYKNPDATARALREGWLCTGDAGVIDDRGHLVVARVSQELQ